MSLKASAVTQTFGFLLIENFALMSYASAIEPLRAANLLAGKTLYNIRPLSCDGERVRCSAGIEVPCEAISAAGSECHTLFVCAGGGPSDWAQAQGIYGVLRRLSRQGVRIGGISSGSYVLASAGLLDNRDFTIHWEHAPALKEAFPHLLPRQARYVLDGNRITCGGGVAPLDMMHAVVAERLGPAFARRVSDWYLHTAVAEPGAPQRASTVERFGTRHPALISVLEKMEATIERPLDRSAMAAFAGVSTRHLDRLFTQQLKSSFLEKYKHIRLQHARRLLEQSPLSIAEVSFATGFSSPGHLSRSFKAYFGVSPKTVR